MAEPREPLRLHPAEAEPSRSSRRGRRLDPVRLAAAVILAGAALWLATLGAQRGFHAVRAWLHAQPTYQLPFSEITLDPPPPDWLRLGATGLLEQVRTGAGRPETLAVLEVDDTALAQDFQRESPWVRAVTGIDHAYPNRLVVSLRYREPVAQLRVSNRWLVLDEESVVLPEDAIDLQRTGPLVKIALAAVDEAGTNVSARPGRVLQLTAAAGASPVEPARVTAALASLFQSRQVVATAGATPSAEPAIAAIQTDAQSRLWVDLTGQLLVLWGRADGTREPGELDDIPKLESLAAWLRDHPTNRPIRPQFLAFDHDRVIVVQPRKPS